MTARWIGEEPVETPRWTLNEKLLAAAIVAVFVVASLLLIGGAR